MKYLIIAFIVTGTLNVFAAGETTTEVCTKVDQSNYCKAPNKMKDGKCVDPNDKVVEQDKGSSGSTGN
jgi:hypothetical protein